MASRKDQHWDSIGHFFAAAAESMRRILADIARKKKNKPRKDATGEVILQLEGIREDITEDQLLQLDVALRRLESEDPEKAKIVVLRYFGGLSIEQIATLSGPQERRSACHLTFSRAWLLREMTREESSDSQE
ncbi:MAG: ECF-type sigma factor [Planctomycetaceae bacterium]